MSNGLRIKTGASIVTPGPIRTCPICAATLNNSEAGVNSHLRKHVREGKIRREDELSVRQEILQRPMRHYPR